MKQMMHILNQHKASELDPQGLARNIREFSNLCEKLLDKDEILIALYLSISRFATPK